GCVGGGQSSFSSRVLFPAVLGSKEERENETGSRSFCSQSVSGGPTFQNGDQQAVLIHSYLDDSLIKNHCRSLLEEHTNLSILLLLRLGFLISWEKIRDNSQSEFQFPGRTFSDRFGSSASSRREGNQGTSVSQCSDSVFICPSSSIASAGGFLDFDHGRHSTRTSTHSSNPVVSVGVLAPNFSVVGGTCSNSSSVVTSSSVVASGKTSCEGSFVGSSNPSLTLFTDASLMGWGAYLEGRTASALWSGAQLEEHINLLEMRAVFLSLRQFQAVIQGQSLLVATDNSTVVAYLQNQGGTHSFSLYHI
ncbi:Hypothetical predicted protein, partial [Mytilus galloprovincialis]